MSLPVLSTPRLILRPFRASDAARVSELAGAAGIAETTLNIPHPYRLEMAEPWIATHEEAFRQGRLVVLAITCRESEGALVGTISLSLTPEHDRGELGYWIGESFWGRGYCTEAAREMIRYGFQELGLFRIGSHHMVRNPASGRVMQKIGMRFEGRRRGIYKKRGAYEDCDFYGMLRADFVTD